MNPTTALTRREGSVLIACILIAMLILAAIVQYVAWVNQSTRADIHRIATQRALTNADSGVQAAVQFLRTPQAAQLHPGVSLTRSSIDEGTTFYLTMTRRVTDTSLVDVYATGYFQLAGGSPSPGGMQGPQAVIYALIQLRTVGDYFAASPGALEISYGSDISSGVVYGRDLTFDSGWGDPRTVVKAASYFDSINPPNYADYVTFRDPGQPLQLASEPVLPAMDLGMRNNYLNMAGSSILPAGTVLAGSVNPPAGNIYNVYWSPGDITLGAVGSSCTLTGSFLVYSEGDIYIANTVNSQLNGSGWPALMAEGNIYVAASAPDDLAINATMVTNGTIKALGPPRTNGSLSVTGGMVAGGGFSFANVYMLKRTYTYQAPDPTLPLPFSTNVILYKVLSGKYNE